LRSTWCRTERASSPPARSTPTWRRGERPNAEWFANRAEAAVLIEAFRRRYDEHRSHSRLGYGVSNGDGSPFTEAA